MKTTSYYPVLMSDDVAAQGVDPWEIEANAFAAELLMPQMFLAEMIDPSLVPALDDADSDEMPQLPVQIPATLISTRTDEVELLKARIADLEARIVRIETALGG